MLDYLIRVKPPNSHIQNLLINDVLTRWGSAPHLHQANTPFAASCPVVALKMVRSRSIALRCCELFDVFTPCVACCRFKRSPLGCTASCWTTNRRQPPSAAPHSLASRSPRWQPLEASHHRVHLSDCVVVHCCCSPFWPSSRPCSAPPRRVPHVHLPLPVRLAEMHHVRHCAAFGIPLGQS